MSFCLALMLTTLAVETNPESYLGVHPVRSVFVEDDAADPDLASGVVVERVVENSPALAAGIKAGDAILRLNGITLRNGEHLNALVATQPVGTRLKVEARRDAELLTLEATTVARVEPRRPAEVRHLLEPRKLGLALATLTAEESKAAGVGPGDGVRVRRLLDANKLEGKIQAGDIITSLNEQAVHGGDDFLALARALEPGQAARLRLQRDGKALDVTVTVRTPESHVSKFHFPLLVIYESKPKAAETTFGVILNIFKYTRKENVRNYRFLWFINFSTGTNDELEEVNE